MKTALPRAARRLMPCLAFAIGAALLPAGGAEPARVWPAPAGEPLSTRFRVQVGGQEAPVYQATVLAMDPERRLHADLRTFADSDLAPTGFASFDVQGGTGVSVTCDEPVRSAMLLPAARGIVPAVSGNRVTFTLPGPGQYVLEVNGDWVRSLQLFANPRDDGAPDPHDPKVLYYGPGIHRVSHVRVGSGQTVYVADGAVVYGTAPPDAVEGAVFILAGDHITLRGRGIIDGSGCPREARHILDVQGSDIRIEGVTLRDSADWTMPCTDCDRLSVRNVKIFGYRGNSDGIDIVNSRDAEVSDCYLRTADDLVVVKARHPEMEGTRNIAVKRCVLWNEFAHALSLGAEFRKDVDNVVFSDCDIIHDKGRAWLLRVYNCDSGRARGITFENIRVEECRRLASLWIGKAVWSRDPERGHIDDVVFRGISSPVPGRGLPYADLAGYDADHAVHGATFNRVKVGGQPLREGEASRNAWVDGLTIVP